MGKVWRQKLVKDNTAAILKINQVLEKNLIGGWKKRHSRLKEENHKLAEMDHLKDKIRTKPRPESSGQN